MWAIVLSIQKKGYDSYPVYPSTPCCWWPTLSTIRTILLRAIDSCVRTTLWENIIPNIRVYLYSNTTIYYHIYITWYSSMMQQHTTVQRTEKYIWEFGNPLGWFLEEARPVKSTHKDRIELGRTREAILHTCILGHFSNIYLPVLLFQCAGWLEIMRERVREERTVFFLACKKKAATSQHDARRRCHLGWQRPQQDYCLPDRYQPATYMHSLLRNRPSNTWHPIDHQSSYKDGSVPSAKWSKGPFTATCDRIG